MEVLHIDFIKLNCVSRRLGGPQLFPAVFWRWNTRWMVGGEDVANQCVCHPYFGVDEYVTHMFSDSYMYVIHVWADDSVTDVCVDFYAL